MSTRRARRFVVRVFVTGACACVLGGALASCGSCGSAARASPLPSSGRACRALGDAERLAVAATCREGAAAGARGAAARQLHAVDLDALREQLDDAFRVIAEQHRSVADLCAEVIPSVTPGLRLSFDGAKDQSVGAARASKPARQPRRDAALLCRPGTGQPPRNGEADARPRRASLPPVSARTLYRLRVDWPRGCVRPASAVAIASAASPVGAE
jgi:hypothetical protein